MSKLYPPSDKKLKELRESDVFPRSPILESTAALIGAALVVWSKGELAISAAQSFAGSAFRVDGSSTSTLLAQLRPLLSFCILLIIGAAVGRLLIIKAESRLFIKWPKVDFGRVFDLPRNISTFFSKGMRAILLSALLMLIFSVAIFPTFGHFDFSNATFAFGGKILLFSIVVFGLLGIVELFRNIVLFGSRYGMTREELLAEQQEMRPELRSEIQGRLSDVD